MNIPRRLLTLLLLVCAPLVARPGPEGGERKPPDLERALVVQGQGYFPVALRLRDGRIAVVLRGGAGHLGWGSPYGRILTMPDGTMLMPVYGGPVRRPGEKAEDSDHGYLYRSTDDGKTWKRYSTPGPGRFNETALLRLASGKLLAAMRT